MLKITNTLSGKKELFTPLEKDTVKLYVCGITPYDHPHIGHGRVYVLFDVLYRFLQFLNYEVTYCRNFTDIDDKLINKAEKELGDKLSYEQIAQKYIQSFTEDLQALNCLTPDHEPRVTTTMPEIIAFIEELIKKGKAYAVDGDVYFSIEQFPTYAGLSKHKLDDLRAGARVEVREKKKDPLDFALWKSEEEGTFWQSPWGYGRPGWHIECSAMAQKYLGDQIDIHGGGMDLIFPHHENEIAQSEGLTGTQFAQYWMHNAFVRVNQEKMSKSLGNFFTLKDVFKHFDPMVIRFYYLNHHYKTPLDFAFDDLEATRKTYQKLCTLFSSQECPDTIDFEAIQHIPVIHQMVAFLADDLNTPGAIGALFSHIDTIKEDSSTLCAVKWLLLNIFGLTLEPIAKETVKITPEIQALIDQRTEARKNKDWTTADKIRDQLTQMGVDLHDKKLK